MKKLEIGAVYHFYIDSIVGSSSCRVKIFSGKLENIDTIGSEIIYLFKDKKGLPYTLSDKLLYIYHVSKVWEVEV